MRCLVRDRSRLEGRSWYPQVEIAEGDALKRDTLVKAMQGVSKAYYLIHGMQGTTIGTEREILAARNFASSAQEAGVKQIIYLGELADPDGKLSPYLRSRHQTGDILREGNVPVTEFRAGMIIGAGSILFEMIRYLTERQPVLICPRWFFTLSQPIYIRDVLQYLVSALDKPESAGELIEIGGATRLTYAEMLQAYAQERQLKRLLIPAPVFSPRLSAYWVHMVSPIHWRQILPLIEGLRVVSMVESTQAREIFPEINPLEFRSALKEALLNYERGNIETSWNDALVSSLGDIRPVRLTTVEGMLIERRQLMVKIPAAHVFKAHRHDEIQGRRDLARAGHCACLERRDERRLDVGDLRAHGGEPLAHLRVPRRRQLRRRDLGPAGPVRDVDGDHGRAHRVPQPGPRGQARHPHRHGDREPRGHAHGHGHVPGRHDGNRHGDPPLAREGDPVPQAGARRASIPSPRSTRAARALPGAPRPRSR